MSKGYFQSLPSEQRSLIGQKGGQSRRSEAVQAAWAAQEKLQVTYRLGEKSVKELAAEFNIPERTMFRVIRGK